MPILRNVEAKIKLIEGIEVHFIKNGANVRSDLTDIPTYPYSVAAPGSWTVSEWVRNRFHKTYPGFDAKVCAKMGLLPLVT